MTTASPQKHSPRAGRPLLSSRESLQDAAFELFLENGYEHTTVDQIASRAGVGRSTFFNYFRSKADVFWMELDEALDGAAQHHPTATTPKGRIREVLLVVAGFFDAGRVPFALTQHHLVGGTEELTASALSRGMRLSEILVRAAGPHDAAGDTARVLVLASLGTALGAALQWADAGIGRGDFGPVLAEALESTLGPAH